MAGLDIQFAFLDNLVVPAEYIHERSLNALVTAARSLGIEIDLQQLAPTRRYLDENVLVPEAEHRAVVCAIFRDPRETLGHRLGSGITSGTDRSVGISAPDKRELWRYAAPRRTVYALG